jgi:hypothetical protein
MQKEIRINGVSIGLALSTIYILSTYIATNIVLNSIYQTLSLYALIAWGIAHAFSHIIRKRKVILNKYSMWYGILLCISFFTMLYSREFSVFSGAFYKMMVVFALTLFIYSSIDSDRSLKVICWAYIVGSVCLFLILYSTGQLKLGLYERLGNGIIVGNANGLAIMMMVPVLYSLWLLLYGNYKALTKIILIFAIIADIYVIMLTGGRKYIIVPVAFLYTLYITKNERNKQLKMIKYTLITVAIIYLLYYLMINVDSLYSVIGKRMETMINGYLGRGALEVSARGRDNLRNLAFSRWIGSPLWGYGFDSFKYYAQETLGQFMYSHCNFAELLHNGGIIVFVAYYWIFFTILKRVIKADHIMPSYKALAIAVIVSLLLIDYGGITYDSLYETDNANDCGKRI